MKPFVPFLALALVSNYCAAQIDFQPGYYIRNDGTKVTCLIKDYGWLNNPNTITCKNSADAAAFTVGMESVAEFAFTNAKYMRFAVDVEISREGTDDLTHSPNPKYRRDTVFLKLLVEGQASLYQYTRKGLIRYFFRLNGGRPVPLISKQYLGNDGLTHVNQDYIRQLSDSLNCSSPDLPNPVSVAYDVKSLTLFFIAYDNCVKSVYTNYYDKTGKTAVHLNIHAGIDLSSLTLFDNSSQIATTKYLYGSNAGIRMGAEAEMVLPVNRNKWAILLGSDYRSYTSDSTHSGYEANYKAIQLSLGGRFYMFLSHRTKLYFTAAVSTNFPFSSTLQYAGYAFATTTRYGEAFSGGFQFHDRFGIELKYSLPQQILDNYPLVWTHLATNSLIISYTIL
jgi:hypothetical protein